MSYKIKIIVFIVLSVSLVIVGILTQRNFARRRHADIFRIYKGTCGFTDEDRQPCLILKPESLAFRPDRAEVIEMIRVEGGDIRGADWTAVFWTIDGNDYDGFTKRLTPKISKWFWDDASKRRP